MNKRYLTKAVACIWLMTILSITGCGQKAATEGNTETQTQTEAERVDTGFVVTNPDSYDSADTAVLVDINEVDKTVTLLNLDLCRDIRYPWTEPPVSGINTARRSRWISCRRVILWM